MIFDNGDMPPRTIASENHWVLKICMPDVYKALLNDIESKPL